MFTLTLTTFFFYAISSSGKTEYDYFTRLGDSFLHGKYYLQKSEPWLNELIPIKDNKFAVVYPPAPAIIAMPFIAIFGSNFEQQILSWIMGALTAFLWGLIAYQKSKNKFTSLWVFLVVAFGNITWYMSSVGSVWYLGQITAYFFITLSIYESLNKKRLGLIGFYFGMAVLSRLQVVLAFPLIVYLNRDRLRHWKSFVIFIVEVSLFGVIYCLYNYLRFNSFFQTGYSLIPGVLDEPWYGGSIFKYSNIISNLKVMFTSMPRYSAEFPYLTPSWGGLAIWITSPIFIYVLPFKKTLQNIITLLSIFLIAIVIFTHGGTGFTQFGYRYAVDFYPLIFLLIVENLTNSKIKWHHIFLLTISVLINLWGVVCINKFGWVGF